ncbi:MAG: hypothetical protein N7Q72_04395, partial [Spiroplasma sp. Tabriz.8]|nr:hypothetical protein [Spiroplasma sp. Tabriz.8]
KKSSRQHITILSHIYFEIKSTKLAKLKIHTYDIMFIYIYIYIYDSILYIVLFFTSFKKLYMFLHKKEKNIYHTIKYIY